MKNLFKYAAEHWKALLLIIAVLFIQAYCDLSLPAYTSDIVNVGIQQGGVEDQVPEQISVEEMDRLGGPGAGTDLRGRDGPAASVCPVG